MPAAHGRDSRGLEPAGAYAVAAPSKRRAAEEEEILDELPVIEEEDVDELEIVAEDERPRRRPKPKPRRRQRRYEYDDYRDSSYRRSEPFLTGGRLLGGLILMFGFFVCCSGAGTASATAGAYQAGAMAGVTTGLLFALGGLVKIIRG